MKLAAAALRACGLPPEADAEATGDGLGTDTVEGGELTLMRVSWGKGGDSGRNVGWITRRRRRYAAIATAVKIYANIRDDRCRTGWGDEFAARPVRSRPRTAADRSDDGRFPAPVARLLDPALADHTAHGGVAVLRGVDPLPAGSRPGRRPGRHAVRGDHGAEPPGHAEGARTVECRTQLPLPVPPDPRGRADPRHTARRRLRLGRPRLGRPVDGDRVLHPGGVARRAGTLPQPLEVSGLRPDLRRAVGVALGAARGSGSRLRCVRGHRLRHLPHRR